MKIVKKLSAILVLASMSGCMSLDERLASSDPTIKREAEIELIRDSFKKGRKQQRLAAVEKVTCQDILIAVAKSATLDTKEEGVASVAKITDKKGLAQIAKVSRVKDVGVAACQKIADQEICFDLAQNAALAETRLVAYEQLQDQVRLLSVAQSAMDRAIKLAAMKRVIDKEKLLPIAFARVTPVRENRGASKVNSATDKITAMKMASAKKGPSMSKVVDSHINETTSSVDVGLVNAFIENCANDDVFIRMIDAYGEKLTSSQCELLRVKSKNLVVHENLNSIADLKIANSLKSWMREPGFHGMDEYCAKFMRIKNKNIKDRVFFETCRQIRSRGELYPRRYYESWIKVVNELGVECMLKCILEKYDNIADYVYCMSDDKALPFIKGIITEKTLSNSYLDAQLDKCFETLLSKVRKEYEDDVIDIIPVGIEEEKLRIVAKKITAPDAAIVFLRKGFKNVQDYMIRDCMLNLDEKFKSRILEEAKKRYESNKSKVCMGPFYLGMPLCDALIQRDALGISGVDAWFVLENVKNENPNIIENWKISAMTFTPKAALKFLDCEDAHVLQQAIKQCVKKQKGRANSWDYASEIRTDVSIDSSTRINFFSPTGTTTDYSSKLVSEYKNAKLGIGLRYEKKTGELCFYKY
jgi:hypothetical protein